MRSRLSIFTGAATLAAIALITVVMLTPTRGIAQGGPQAYTMDTDHLSVIFKVKHMDFSYVYGRFNKVEGGFVINENDPANSSFNMTIMAASVDTNVRNRDQHLRNDFLQVKPYPRITLESTKVQRAGEGYQVTGDLTLLDETKSVTLDLALVGEGFNAMNNQKHTMGFGTGMTIKRSDYGMDALPKAVGDEVTLMISFEGVRQ